MDEDGNLSAAGRLLQLQVLYTNSMRLLSLCLFIFYCKHIVCAHQKMMIILIILVFKIQSSLLKHHIVRL